MSPLEGTVVCKGVILRLARRNEQREREREREERVRPRFGPTDVYIYASQTSMSMPRCLFSPLLLFLHLSISLSLSLLVDAHLYLPFALYTPGPFVPSLHSPSLRRSPGLMRFQSFATIFAGFAL